MAPAETKVEYIVRAKAILREDLRAQSWPEKVRAIERMNASRYGLTASIWTRDSKAASALGP